MRDMSLTAGLGRTYKWLRPSSSAKWAFGDGIGFSSFVHRVDAVPTSTDGALGTFEVTVTGDVPGSEAVLTFAAPVTVPGAEGPLPLAPGGSERHQITVEDFDVSMVDSLGRRYQHAGTDAVQFDRDSGHMLEKRMTVGSTVLLDTLPHPPPGTARTKTDDGATTVTIAEALLPPLSPTAGAAEAGAGAAGAAGAAAAALPIAMGETARVPPASLWQDGEFYRVPSSLWFCDAGSNSQPARVANGSGAATVNTTTQLCQRNRSAAPGLQLLRTIRQFSDFPGAFDVAMRLQLAGQSPTHVCDLAEVDWELPLAQNETAVLRGHVGGNDSAADFSQYNVVLGATAEAHALFTSAGGRPSGARMPVFSLALPDGGGYIWSLGWSGNWEMTFSASGGRLRIRISSGVSSSSGARFCVSADTRFVRAAFCV
eukprot:SAG22_NODE_236_length_14254_cov_3.426492_7_plen_427_part_00